MSLLDLSTRVAALKGGQKSGPAIVPGDSAKSPFYHRLTGQEQPAMPLGGKLSDAEITTIKEWIDAGAVWEGAVSAPPAPRPPQPQPLRRSSPSRIATGGPSTPCAACDSPSRDARWSANPIDAFIKKALDDKGLEPAPAADRRTLIRRATST